MFRIDPALLARTYRDPLALFALAVDSLPVFAVLFLGWGATPLVMLYWLENVILGAVTLVRMLATGLAQGPVLLIGSLFMGAFFTFHYGMFTFVHGIFVTTLAALGASEDPGGFPTPLGLIEIAMASGPGMGTILALIIAWHVAAFAIDFIGRGEVFSADLSKEMGAPYGRVVVLHIGLFAGFGALIALGEPMIGVLGLIVLRIAWGIYMSTRRRQRLDAQPAQS